MLRLIFFLIVIFCSAQQPIFNDMRSNTQTFQFDLTEYYKNLTENTEGLSVDAEGYVILDPVEIDGAKMFNNDLDRNYYGYLKRRVKILYPLLSQVLKEYYQLSDSLQTYKNNKQIRELINKRQDELSLKYEAYFKTLKSSDGEILCALIHKETGKTAYDIIKELKGTFGALAWEAKAGLFNIDLERKYDPIEIRQDEFLEKIISKEIETGEISPISR